MSLVTHRKIPVGRNSMFYEVPTSDVEDVQSGYLYKSPPPSVLTKSMKSWKRRFFVLSMVNGHLHELKYYKDENKRDKPIGEIELYETSLLLLQPEAHPTWEWIQKNFRCSSSCVLFMRVIDRDYFLIGENSTEMDGWFNAIFAALKTHTLIIPEENRKTRSISEPSHVKTTYNDQDLAESEEQELQKRTPSPSARRSAPEFTTLYDHYDYPRSFMMKTSPKSEDEEEEEEEEEVTGCYMDMASVRKVAIAVDSEDDMNLQTQKNTNCLSALSLSGDFCNGQVDEGQDTGHPCQRLTGGDKGPDDAFQNTKSGSTGSSRQIPQESGALNPVQKEICVSQEELKKNVIFSEEAGKPCVSDWKHIQSSGPFHEGDQIVAINDLLTDSLEEVQTYLRRLSKDEVKLTILRQPGSRPLSGCSA
ncbi:pleckstrin homology domain-containing family S member 1-like [Salminus brasiliensis]|uniref:pleckstrin homology domain-containing family S member 1-like n=1 Tax=Salminus brasiliensis TaxID=930266 RepID=UPI003B8395B4